MEHHRTGLNPGKFFFLLLAALVLASLPLLIFHPIKQKVSAPVKKTRFAFMTNLPTDMQDPHDLLYWQKVGNPMLFAKPDPEFGFSAFYKPARRHSRPGNIQDLSLPELQKFLNGSATGIEPGRRPSTLLADPMIPMVRTVTEKLPEFMDIPAAAVLENGTVFPLNSISPADIAGKTLEPSVFHVSRTNDDAPPEIRLIRSSGNAKLDQQALRAIYLPAAEKREFNGIVRIEWKQEEVSR